MKESTLNELRNTLSINNDHDNALINKVIIERYNNNVSLRLAFENQIDEFDNEYYDNNFTNSNNYREEMILKDLNEIFEATRTGSLTYGKLEEHIKKIKDENNIQ